MKRFLFIFLVAGLAILPAGAQALTIDSSQDCDANAVINCGLTVSANAGSAYQRPGVSDIYADFGINRQDMADLSNNAVVGVVTSNNNVWIRKSSGLCPDADLSTLSAKNQQAIRNNPNLCLAATNAMTAGRQYIPGSTKVMSGGTTYYSRPPSVSFQTSSLPAYVVMKNGRFAFAIIASCGNPVKASAVTVKPKVKASSTVRPTAAQPPAVTQSQTQTQSQSQTVNITQPPAVIQTATPAPVSKPVTTQALPNTGPGQVIGLGGISTIVGTIGHLIYSRRQRA